jgi:hypothetical protein
LLELREGFESLEDKRFQPYGEHLLPDTVTVTLTGVLSDADERVGTAAFARAKEGRLKTFLKLPDGIPSRGTIQRVTPVTGGSAPRREHTISGGEDRRPCGNGTGVESGGRRGGGKTGKGGRRNETGRDAAKATRAVSACSADRGLGLSEIVADEKSDEMPAVRGLLNIT